MNFHTEALWREIKVHVDMGMSPQRAISRRRASTRASSAAARISAPSSPASSPTSSSSRAIRSFNIIALADVESS